MEHWKPIEGYEGLYEVSDYGRVVSLRRAPKLVLSQSTSSTRYMRVSLNKNGSHKTVLVHRLVAKAFISNPFHKPQVNHKDGNRQNNLVENLEWVTSSENIQHAYDFLGKVSPAKGHAFNRKLSDGQVMEIRSSDKSCYVLGRMYGLAPSSICAVKNKKTFANID